MKKIYMTPTTKWVEAQAEEMMSASDLIQSSGDDLIQDLSKSENTTTETSGNLSRQGLWDDTDF